MPPVAAVGDRVGQWDFGNRNDRQQLLMTAQRRPGLCVLEDQGGQQIARFDRVAPCVGKCRLAGCEGRRGGDVKIAGRDDRPVWRDQFGRAQRQPIHRVDLDRIDHPAHRKPDPESRHRTGLLDRRGRPAGAAGDRQNQERQG